MGETKRQQQKMVRVMGSTRDALGRFRDDLQREVMDAKNGVYIYGPWRVTLADALEEAMRRVGASKDSRVNDLLWRKRKHKLCHGTA